MICITSSAAFILPSRPEICDLGILLPIISLDRFEGVRISYYERDAETFPTSPLSATATHDTAPTNARIGAETIFLRVVAIIDVKLGDTDVPVTNILRLANDGATLVLRLKVGFVTAASRACRGLLVCRNNVPDAIPLRETLWQDISLARTPVIIFLGNDRGRNRGRVLDVLHLTTTWSKAASTPSAISRFLMNPCLLLVFLMGVATVEVVRLAYHPIDRRLAESHAATLTS
mmetsp:Transcript_6397/g.14085  ORF Transcript_6397/g.14085 Transcript_6397/m.14085 type:complete len:232 (-) Transcript_6397:166-861(-)